VFLFAFLIRLPGIGWGLPNEFHNQSYHPDEQVIFTFSTGIDIGQGRFLPGDYHYGSLYLTLLSIAGKVISGYGGGVGLTEASLWAFIGKVDLAGRLISALAGAGTALVVFLFLRRRTGMLGSLAGAALIALAPAFVVHSRFQTVDVLATFLLALSLYYSSLLIPAESDPDAWKGKFIRLSVLAGLFAGLSAGTKYTGILALVGLYVCGSISGRPEKAKALLLGTVAALVAFIVSTPGAIFDQKNFIRDFRYEMIHTSTGHDLLFVNVGSGFLYHIVNLVAGISPILFVLALIGVGISLWQRQRWIWGLAAFSLLYYLLIGRAEVLFLRYTFPLYLILAIGFGWWMGECHAKAGRSRGWVGLGILALGVAATSAMQFTTWMMGDDPRDITAKALREEAKTKPSATVGIVSDPWYYTVPLIPDSASMRGLWPLKPHTTVEEVQLQEMAESRAPKMEQAIPSTSVNDRYDWDPSLLTNLKPDRIVYSSFEQYDLDRLQSASNLDPIAKLRVDRYRDFQQRLSQDYRLDSWEATDYSKIPDLEYIHPYMFIWKRKDHS
jgi:hypothetical protein